MRDLDFGRAVIDWFEQLAWPEDVVVEDLSCSAPLVLHRLQELRPAKVVLVGAVARGLDPPGTVRRYPVDLTPPRPAEVHRSVEEAVMGMVDLDHTLAMARHWGGLPPDSVVVEVEPADTGFGLGFSDALAACLDAVVDAVRQELDLDAGPDLVWEGEREPVDGTSAAAGPVPSEALEDLRGYARLHAQARLHTHRAPALVHELSAPVPGVELAGQVRAWGVFVDTGGDWFDAVPLDHGALGIVVGGVPERGVEGAAAMSDLRAAVRAYAVRDGASPASLVGQLDRLAELTGLGRHARLMYLVVQPATGEVRYCDAGGCPPLILDNRMPGGRFTEGTGGPALGAGAGVVRHERSLRLSPGSTLLLFTEGLVQSQAVSRAAGMRQLQAAAVGGPEDVEELCDHVLTVCTGKLRRDDDVCLLCVRLAGAVTARAVRPSAGGPR